MPVAFIHPELSHSDFELENMANPLQNLSFTPVSLHPIISKQSNGCKLNFLNAVRGYYMLSYTRVYVEIDASKLLVKEFDLQCFLMEWCSSCNVFDHNLATCPANHNDKASMMGEAKMKKAVYHLWQYLIV
uniref:Uncharacterized protein n=1 Tax=Populus trichocarpa TaxID=3694 RepID=B9N2Y7_POPTR